MNVRRPVLACLLTLFLPAIQASDWGQFRGGSSGRIEQISHPMTWDSTKNVAWTVPMKGSGWSSPIVAGDRIFLTAAVPADGSRPKGMMAGVASMGSYRRAKPVEHTFIVQCLALNDGKLLWEKTVAKKTPAVVHPSNTYATESPATDGQQVYTFFATTGDLTAWDLDGKQLWTKNTGAFKSGNGFGTGSSLAIHDSQVFVQYDNDESSFVAAYSAADGSQIWKDQKRSKTSWSTPLIWKAGKTVQLVTCGSGVVTSYDAASGKVVWRLSGIRSSFSASPCTGAGHIFFGNSGPMSAGPLVAVEANTVGQISLDRSFQSPDVAWSKTRSGPGMASPVVSQGRLYIPGSGGILNCYDASTGERVYRTRVPGMATVAASLWADEKHVFILDESGTTHVIPAGPTFERVAANKVADLFWSTPAVAGNRLLLRGVEKLYCIAGDAE